MAELRSITEDSFLGAFKPQTGAADEDEIELAMTVE